MLARLIPKTADNMVVDESRGLHMGIDDRRADEFETPRLQVLTESV
jgi:hypothetical protein